MDHLTLAQNIAAEFQRFRYVDAIALGGSHAHQQGITDQSSDIDLYIYGSEIVPVDKRKAIIEKLGASRVDLNLTFWDTGDEWYHRETGIEVDMMFWSPAWIEGELDKVIFRHQANMGYTTCFWRTIRHSSILFDRTGWFADLQAKTGQPYPEALKRAIIEKNHPVLRTVIPAYYGQIKKAIQRNDIISINHRLAALLASYFDIIFALNEVLHPGEKKLLKYVNAECAKIPENLDAQLAEIFQSAATGDAELLAHLDGFLDNLDELLEL